MKRDRLTTTVFLSFLGGSDGKESAGSAGDLGSVSGLGRSPGGGHGNPLQHSCLENPQGQRHLADCSPWGWKELDMTEQLLLSKACVIFWPISDAWDFSSEVNNNEKVGLK